MIGGPGHVYAFRFGHALQRQLKPLPFLRNVNPQMVISERVAGEEAPRVADL